jgi:hypothetical protein
VPGVRRVAAPALLLFALIAAAPAGAASLPRVSGHWFVRFTPVNYHQDSTRTKWFFRPNCPLAEGACDVRVRSSTGRFYVYTLKGGWYHYDSPRPTRPMDRCELGDRTVYHAWRETVHEVFHATRSLNGYATRLRGTLRTTFKPTRRARAKGCRGIVVHRDRVFARLRPGA